MTDEIRWLSVLFDEFRSEFQPTPNVLKVYKNELNKHIEDCIGRNLTDGCTNEVNASIPARNHWKFEAVTSSWYTE
jgi:mitofusin